MDQEREKRVAETIAEARAQMRRLAVAGSAPRIDAARELAARFSGDAPVLRMAVEFFVTHGAGGDAADAAAALLRLDPADFAVVGRCLHVLRADGRGDLASAEATRILDLRRSAARERPHVVAASRLLPHLAAYYDEGSEQQWLPYVMLGGRACVRGDVLNTDERGFRYTMPADGTRFSLADDPDRLGNAVVVGGSTVFGVGAGCDAGTLPSCLSGPRWRYYNMGCRAYVLAQNTVAALFELSRLRPVRRIVLLAGWNDIAVLARAEVVPRGFGPFFTWNVFCRSFNKVAAHFPEEDWPAAVRARYSTPSSRGGDLAHAEVMGTVASMLDAWRMFADHLGAELSYVLQPARDWMDRAAPAAEEEVCRAISGQAMAGFAELAAWARPWYADALRVLCAERGIPFLDGNRLMERHPLRDAWLFVDAAHLTDLGHRVLAEVLSEELDHGH